MLSLIQLELFVYDHPGSVEDFVQLGHSELQVNFKHTILHYTLLVA
jgi:hypothetical protein